MSGQATQRGSNLFFVCCSHAVLRCSLRIARSYFIGTLYRDLFWLDKVCIGQEFHWNCLAIRVLDIAMCLLALYAFWYLIHHHVLGWSSMAICHIVACTCLESLHHFYDLLRILVGGRCFAESTFHWTCYFICCIEFDVVPSICPCCGAPRLVFGFVLLVILDACCQGYSQDSCLAFRGGHQKGNFQRLVDSLWSLGHIVCMGGWQRACVLFGVARVPSGVQSCA